MARKALRATLHHGDVYEVKVTPFDGKLTTGTVIRALGATSYGTSLQYDDQAAHDIVADLLAGRATGRGWVHLDLFAERIGIVNAAMWGTPSEPGEHVNWSAPDYFDPEDFADIFRGQTVEGLATECPHLIVFVADDGEA